MNISEEGVQDQQRRIVIQKIVLNNFKSYKGEKVIGPFHHRFSCIIGPNGSGKSNLVDSLVFVFGKKAAWMRVKYLRELIHNSDNQECSNASVTVHFQEIIDSCDDEVQYIEGTQFCITRQVNHKSESQFFLNGTKMTQKKIIELLKTKKIDLEKNRFMILQGEVEQIALMKPKSGNMDNPGLLEYLEDIIGSDQYVERIDQLEIELQAYSFMRIESNDKMYASKLKISELKKKKDNAIEYLEKEKFVFQLKNFLEQVHMFYIVEEVNKCKQTKQKFVEDQNNLSKEIKTKFSEYDTQIKKIEKIKEKLSIQDKELKKVEEQNTKLKSEYAEKINHSKRVTFLRQELKEEIEKLDIKKSKCIDGIGELKELLKELFTKLDIKEKRHNELFVEIEKQRPYYEQEIKQIEQKITEKEKIILQIQKEKNIVEQYKNQHDEQIEEQKKELKESEDQFQNQLMEKDKIKEKISRADENSKESQREEQALLNVLEKNEQNFKEIQSELNQILNDIKNLERNIDDYKQQKNHRMQNLRVHQKLMDAQAQGKLRGLIGRFGDLVAIKDKYALPICTVSEQFANSILVRTVEDGQRALHYLKTHAIGRMKFWALDQVQNLQQYYDRPFKAPAQSIRIFDTLNYDANLHPNFKSLIFKLFNNILITENLKTANFLAYEDRHRWEVVTMDGSHINKHGMLSKKQHQNSDYFTNRLDTNYTNQVNISEQEKQLAELQQEFSEKSMQKNKIERIKNENSEKCKNFREKVFFYNTKFKEFTNNFKQLEESNLQLDLKIKTIQKTLQEIESNYSYEETADNLKGLETKLKLEEQKKNKLEQKKLKIGSEDFQNLMQEYDQLYNEVIKLKDGVNEAEAQQSHQEKELKNYQEKQKQYKNELSAKELEQEEANKEIALIVEKASDIDKKRNDILNKKVEIEEELDTFGGQLDELNKYIQEKKVIQKDIKQKINEIQEEIDYNKNKLNQFLQSLDAIRSNYESSQKQYIFLQKIDEIEKLGQAVENEQNIQNDSNEDEEAKQEEVEQETSKRATRARPRRNKDWQFVKNVDVMDEYDQDILLQYQSKDQNLILKNFIKAQEDELKKMSPYLDVLKRYKDEMEEYIEKQRQHQEVKQKEEELQKKLFDLKDRRKSEFNQGLEFISKKMKEIYKTFAKGGDAELESLETSNPFSKGIVFSVKPHKTWSSISVLSGGQKTLVSLSFIYALHYYKPNSIYFMDEIDAALDYKNRGLVGEFIKTRTKEAQFIVISLRNEMFEKSDLLVGVYKNYNISKTVSLNIKATMEKLEKQKNDKKINQFIQKNIQQ